MSKRDTDIIDITDTNVKVVIAYVLLIIAFLLVYVAFVK